MLPHCETSPAFEQLLLAQEQRLLEHLLAQLCGPFGRLPGAGPLIRFETPFGTVVARASMAGPLGEAVRRRDLRPFDPTHLTGL